MTWQSTPFTIPLLGIVIAVTLMAAYLWVTPGTPIVRHAALLLLASAFWLFGVTVELAGSDLQTKIFWNKVQYFGAVTVPLGWLLLAGRILGQPQWMKPTHVASLAFVPMLTLIAAWTNEWHRLVWSSHELRFTGSFYVLINGHGIVYWLYYLYASILGTVATFLLLRAVARERDLYKGQAGAFLLSGLIPLSVSLLDLVRPDLFGHLNPLPLALIGGVVAVVWGITRFRSGDIVPIARKLVMESIADGVLVMDKALRLVDLNPAAQNLLQVNERDYIGRPMAQVWPQVAELMANDSQTSGHTTSWVVQNLDETRTLDIRVSALVDWQKVAIGSVIVVRDITEMISSTKQLQASLCEKETLLKEIHHRVKNNLQIISSLLNLQSNTVDNPLTLAQFQDSQNRIRSMALIHEHLYRSDDLARIDFSSYLHNLVDSLVQTYRSQSQSLNLKIETDPMLLDMDTAIPCGLIVNELVSNALKHAFPQERTGQIGIVLRHERDKRQYHLVIGDDGIGIPGDLDYQHTTSLGLQLVNSLARQINGTIALCRENGTQFDIRFPDLGAGRQKEAR